MITKENYHKEIAKIGTDTLPDYLRDGHKVFLESEEFYNDEDTKDLKAILDDHIRDLNEYLSQNIPKEQTKKLRQKAKRITKKTEAEPKPRKSKTSKQSQDQIVPNQVEMLREEVRFIRRLITFHNKPKQLTSLLSFIKALQRAIVQKLIRKTSPLADDIQKIQERMVKFYNQHAHEEEITIVINDQDLVRYVAIVGGERVYKSIGIIKRFIAMQGKEIEQEKVDVFLKSLDKAKTPDDPYLDKLDAIMNFILKKKKGKPVKVEEQELNGLQDIVDGCVCHHLGKIYDSGLKELRRCNSRKYSDAKKGACSHHNGLNRNKKCKELDGIMTAEEVAVQEYETLDFDGKYRALMGNPATNFDMMLFGIAGSGKTTFLIQFAHYLCTKFGKPTLYVSGEEFNSLPLTLKIRELPSLPSKLFFAKNINSVPIPLENFGFIILDSVTDLGINLETYKRLREDYPEAGFIVILQTRKDGQFKGGKEWEHEMEVAGVIENGTVSIYKNRYGVKGQLNFFEN